MCVCVYDVSYDVSFCELFAELSVTGQFHTCKGCMERGVLMTGPRSERPLYNAVLP